MSIDRKVGLSGLALGVSAATMLGISGVAIGVDQSNNCAIGPSCNAGWFEIFQGIDLSGVGGYQEGAQYWAAEGTEFQQYMNYFMNEGGYWSIGSCQLRTGAYNNGDPTCGCGATEWGVYATIRTIDGVEFWIEPTWVPVDRWGATGSNSECWIP